VRASREWPWISHRVLLRSDAHPLVAIDRVAARLEALGGSHNAYACLFDPDGPLAELDPDVSPWELRPPLCELFWGCDEMAAMRAARREGYRLAEIAAHLGVSEATISRRLARAA
jgi:AraC-like DNA-binding protein